jgi:hypothetical protein
LPTSACGLDGDYTAFGGGAGVAGVTFVSRIDGGADPAVGCKFELPTYAQDADCAEHTDNCEAGLRCAVAVVDTSNAGNVQSVCIPTASCGLDGEYTAPGGSDPDINGVTFRTLAAGSCVENPIKPAYEQDEDCSVDPTNCDGGLQCA